MGSFGFSACQAYPDKGTGTSEDVFNLLVINRPTRVEGIPGSSDPKSSPLPLCGGRGTEVIRQHYIPRFCKRTEVTRLYFIRQDTRNISKVLFCTKYTIIRRLSIFVYYNYLRGDTTDEVVVSVVVLSVVVANTKSICMATVHNTINTCT